MHLYHAALGAAVLRSAQAFTSFESNWVSAAVPFPAAPDYLLEYRQSPCSDHEFFLSKGGLLTVRSKSGLLPGFSFEYPEDEVYTWADHGTLGLELHPDFPAQPYLFMFISLENTPPWNDQCPNVVEGKSLCKSFGRLARFKLNVEISPNGTCTSMSFTNTTSNPYTLFEGLCSTSNTHGIGDLKFRGPNLLLSSGDLSQAPGADWGNVPGDVCYNSNLTYPQGRFRSQRMDFLNGKLWEIYNSSLFMTTGQLQYGRDFRFVAIGMRQPYAIAVDPISLHVYTGEVGSNIREEINHLTPADFARTTPINLGWPCIEGSKYLSKTGALLDKDWIQNTCDPATMNCELCGDIYPCATNAPGVGGCSADYRPPAYEYRHVVLDKQYPKECTSATSSISGLAIFNGSYPQFGETGIIFMPHNLVAIDYSTGCMWYFKPKADGTPDFTGGAHLLLTNHFASSLHLGRDGYLYSTLTDPNNLIRHGVKSSSDPPEADLVLLSNTTGSFVVCAGTCQVPLGASIRFDANATVPGGATVANYTFAFGDMTPNVTQASPVITHSYGAATGTMYVSVTARDKNGATNTVRRVIIVGVGIGITMLPAPGMWKLGDTINYTLNLPQYLDGSTIDGRASVSHCLPDACTGVSCHTHPWNMDSGYAHATIGKMTPGEHDMPSTMQLLFTITPPQPSGGDPFDVSFGTYCLQYFATLQTVVSGSSVPRPWPIASGELDPCMSPCLPQPFMANTVAVLSANSIQSDYLGNIFNLTGWTATKAGGLPVSISTGGSLTASPRISENGTTYTANYANAGATVPTDSSKPGWAPGPALVALKGFRSNIEVVWELPPSTLRTWDWVIVSVVNFDFSRDASATFPADGPSTVLVPLPAGTRSYNFNVSIAGYNSTTNKRTAFTDSYLVPRLSYDGLDVPCEYTPYGPYAYDPDLPASRFVITNNASTPTTIEFEYYAEGGQGIAYYDTQPQDTGSRGKVPIRNEDVDVQQNSKGSGIGNVVSYPTEWLTYPIKVDITGVYTFVVNFGVQDLNVAASTAYFMLDRADCTPAAAVASYDFPANLPAKFGQSFYINGVPLPAGEHTLRFCEEMKGYAFDKFTVQATSVTPAPMKLTSAPGTPKPTGLGTPSPTVAPTLAPTPKPTRAVATSKPTKAPTFLATSKPTKAPTSVATSKPTKAPGATSTPTNAPTLAPTL